MALRWPSKDPDDNGEWFHVVWCSADGTNDGSSLDTGRLQGDTIQSVTWTVPTGLTKVSENLGAVSIRGVTYDTNTVAQIQLSGGTVDTEYTLLCRVTKASDSKTMDQTCILKVEAH